MRRLWFLVVLTACFSPKLDFTNGTLACGAGNACPPQHQCLQGACWRDGTAPALPDGPTRMPGDIIWVRSMSAAFGLGVAEGASGLVFSGSITAPANLGGGVITPLGATDMVIGGFDPADA